VKKIYKMQLLEGSGTPVLCKDARFLKVKQEERLRKINNFGHLMETQCGFIIDHTSKVHLVLF
jgi:hypothetical protein